MGRRGPRDRRRRRPHALRQALRDDRAGAERRLRASPRPRRHDRPRDGDLPPRRRASSRSAAIVAPGVGLKEGILEELVDKYFHVWDAAGEAQTVLAACARLGRRYQFDEAHGTLVSDLAAQLFDDLRDVHAMGDRDRLLLRAAAMLHDVGDFVRYDGHHKHSYYLILHSDIMGLTPDERAIVANVARYHRKSTPDPSHPNFRDLDKDARGKVRGLAAILRIADALDREHLGKIDGVQASVDTAKRRVVLHVARARGPRARGVDRAGEGGPAPRGIRARRRVRQRRRLATAAELAPSLGVVRVRATRLR